MMRTQQILMALVTSMLVSACSGTPDLDTRTFRVTHIDENAVMFILEPYVYSDRPGAPGTMSISRSTVTVRETPDNLDKIERVLAEFDKPIQNVRLRFQLISANGNRTNDPRIAEVESALRELFRFEGYSLEGEALIVATEGSSANQTIRGERGSYYLSVRVIGVPPTADGMADLVVELRSPNLDLSFETGVRVPIDQTVVLGSASAESAAIILTVRPELVSQ